MRCAHEWNGSPIERCLNCGVERYPGSPIILALVLIAIVLSLEALLFYTLGGYLA